MSDRFDHTLEHTLKTKPDEPEADDAVTSVRRIELITGAGRRRQWSGDDKARIIVESFTPGANVSEVARRNGLSPQQLFGWRREARELMVEQPHDAPRPERTTPTAARLKNSKSRTSAAASSDCVPAFASVVIAAAAPPSPPSPPAPPASGHIEIAIGDAIVRIVGSVDAAHLTAVLRAVRRAS